MKATLLVTLLALLAAGPRPSRRECAPPPLGDASVSQLVARSRCLQDAGKPTEAVGAAYELLTRAASDPPRVFPLVSPEAQRWQPQDGGFEGFLPRLPIEAAAGRLDELGVDVPIPPPGTCGELPSAPGCAKTFLACTERLGDVDVDGETRFDALEINVAHTPRESRFFEEQQRPTLGRPLGRPPLVTLPWLERADHATFVLQATLERVCLPNHVGCRLDTRDGGQRVASTDCRLVIADACLEVVGTACRLRAREERRDQVQLMNVVPPP